MIFCHFINNLVARRRGTVIKRGHFTGEYICAPLKVALWALALCFRLVISVSQNIEICMRNIRKRGLHCPQWLTRISNNKITKLTITKAPNFDQSMIFFFFFFEKRVEDALNFYIFGWCLKKIDQPKYIEVPLQGNLIVSFSLMMFIFIRTLTDTLCFKFLCVIDLTHTQCQWCTGISEFHVTRWVDKTRQHAVSWALVASDTPKWRYLFFIWLLIFSMVWQVPKNIIAPSWGSRTLTFSSGKSGTTVLQYVSPP